VEREYRLINDGSLDRTFAYPSGVCITLEGLEVGRSLRDMGATC
jgi:hypothetical protein